MIAIIDYGMGNLRSVQKALEKVGGQAMVTQNPQDLTNAQGIVLPGVGAMRPAMGQLNALGFTTAIKKNVEAGKPFLGICLGCQLLFETSDEGGKVQGLGLLKGEVKRFPSLKIPQIGWNQLNVQQTDCPLLTKMKTPSFVYFCHSYYVKPNDANVVAATTDYGIEYASLVWQKNIFGVQFHPEKSQTIGLNLLKNFLDYQP
ncbi:MAG: imidazole glycerol phosphate synthase subunit HisH [Candidatus Omnitrophota bacterium]|nr:imidazole glycerol phosphate synthase subunit HisH [Candidatus Omnitrophota bacterium]